MSKKYTLTLSKKQLQIVSTALDTWSRLFGGQFSNIPYDLRKWDIDRHKFSDLLKSLLFPELSPGESYGIYSHEIPDDARIAFDIYHMLNYVRQKDSDKEEGKTTHNVFTQVNRTSETEELPVVEVICGDDDGDLNDR